MLGAQAGAGALGWACVGRWAGVRGALGRGAWQAWRAAGARRQGRWRAQAWAHRLAGGRRKLQAGAQGAGRARVLGERAQAGGRRAAAGARTWQGRAGRAERAGQGWLGGRHVAWRWARPGCAGWPWAVHSVHSACFWPGSTRYFLESNFLDIVREPGS